MADRTSSAIEPALATNFRERLGAVMISASVETTNAKTIEYIPCEFRGLAIHDYAGDRDTGKHGGHGKSESPVPSICKSKSSDKSGYGLNGQCHLLRDALLNQICPLP